MILTLNQQQTYKAISANNRNKFDQINEEVYSLHVIPIFGLDFLADVEDNLTNVTYKELLFGCDYEISGITYRHGGLLKVIAYFNYGYYAEINGIEDTYTGLQKAIRDQMEEATQGEKGRIIKNTYKLAYTEAERVRHYLDNNCDTFTKWKSTAVKEKVTIPNFYGSKKK